jgi:hypothetical protein
MFCKGHVKILDCMINGPKNAISKELHCVLEWSNNI